MNDLERLEDAYRLACRKLGNSMVRMERLRRVPNGCPQVVIDNEQRLIGRYTAEALAAYDQVVEATNGESRI